MLTFSQRTRNDVYKPWHDKPQRRSARLHSMLFPLLILIIFPCILAVQTLRRAPSGNNTVIIQLFEWSWDSITSECTNFIGPAGYGFVQGKLLQYFCLSF